MPPSLLTDIRVEPLQSATDYRAADLLYTRVFGYDSADLRLNANLLSALRQNGGSTVGAFAPDGRLVGFAYGFAGVDAQGTQFHYSQTAVVDAEFQGLGVGHLLKNTQREIALVWGQQRMRWVFDPRLVRNAHFNLHCLGAEAHRYERDYYGRPGSDRLMVEWDLTRIADPFASERNRRPPADLAECLGLLADAGDGAVWVVVPNTPRDDTSNLREAFESALEGRCIVACVRVDVSASAYLAIPVLSEGTMPRLPEHEACPSDEAEGDR